MSYSHFDFHMMRLLYHCLAQGSVTRAAEIMGMAQPTASQMLRRWRESTGDALLVRSGSRMIATDHGRKVLHKLGLVLGEIDEIFQSKTTFDAATSRRTVTLFAANSLGPFLTPRIVTLVRHAAPHVQLALRPIMSEGQLLSDMEEGHIDLAVGNWPSPPINMHYARLMQSNIVCVVCRSHPLADKPSISLAEYLTLKHLSPTPASSLTISPISSRLAQIGVRRNITLSVPEFSLVPQVLADSDLVFTTAWLYAKHIALQDQFCILEAPKELGTMTFYMLWHDRLHHSAYGQWLRDLVKQAALQMG